MEIETRADGSIRICGYVNAVERDSRLLPQKMAPTARRAFVEKIEAGTFKKALEENPDVPFFFNHNRKIECERRLEEDAVGLRAELITSDPEIKQAAADNRLTGWSFGFRGAQEHWEDAGMYDRRTISALRLDEVSLLTLTPAYIATTVELRSSGGVIDAELAKKIIEIKKRKGTNL